MYTLHWRLFNVKPWILVVSLFTPSPMTFSLDLANSIFQDVELNITEDSYSSELPEIFDGSIEDNFDSDLKDINLCNSLSPDYFIDTDSPKKISEKTQLKVESPVLRRQSSRIQDKIRHEIAEKIRLENERLEQEAECLGSKKSSVPESIDQNSELYCICRQPHNKRFMICCDRCDEWFHGDCVQLTPERGARMEEQGIDFVCPSCRPENYETLVPKSSEEFTVDPNAVKISVKPAQKDILDATKQKKRAPVQESLESEKVSPKRVCERKSDPPLKGIKYQQVLDWKCLGSTCRNRVDSSHGLYCSSNCLKSYVKHILEQNMKRQNSRFGTKASLLQGKQRLVLLDRRDGTVFSGSHAPLAKTEDLHQFLENKPTCQVILTKSSNPSKPAENNNKHNNQLGKRLISEKDKETIDRLRQRAKRMMHQALERKVRKSRSGVALTRKQIEQLVEKLDEALIVKYSLELDIHAAKDFLEHMLLLKQFFYISQTSSDNTEPDLTLHQKMGKCLLGALSKSKLTATRLVAASSQESLESLAKHFRISNSGTSQTPCVNSSSAIKDTTDQHDRHMFDLNCSLCNPPKKLQTKCSDEEPIAKPSLESETSKPEPVSEDELQITASPVIAPATFALIRLVSTRPSATPLESSDPSLVEMFKASMYPMYRVRPQSLPSESLLQEFIQSLPSIPKELLLARYTLKEGLPNYIHQHLHSGKKEMFVYRMLPGSLSFVDERSRNTYHDLYWKLNKQKCCISLKCPRGFSKFCKDCIIFPGPDLPVPLSCGGEINKPAYTKSHEAGQPPPVALGPHSTGAFVYSYFNCDFSTHSKLSELPARQPQAQQQKTKDSKPRNASEFSQTVKDITTDALRKILASVKPEEMVKQEEKEEQVKVKEEGKFPPPKIIPLGEMVGESDQQQIPGFADSRDVDQREGKLCSFGFINTDFRTGVCIDHGNQAVEDKDSCTGASNPFGFDLGSQDVDYRLQPRYEQPTPVRMAPSPPANYSFYMPRQHPPPSQRFEAPPLYNQTQGYAAYPYQQQQFPPPPPHQHQHHYSNQSFRPRGYWR
ncbi:hypothetical protein Ciccas_004512 [Cichlidogyrus casuarinus]|uniref:PHD-type domain-containing protein n=1 Tax=Cichlidogyrus casuarinus TaxID=1844966 RepID=A0ABD2QBE0_9PLAT